jgi:hypothetical protein
LVAKPEEAAREEIDRLLTQAGWPVCTAAEANISAHRGIAIREFPLKQGHGFADYMLYVDGKAAGVIEAKKTGATLVGVQAQSAKYTAGLPDALPAWRRPLAFAYESTGVETRFTNGLDETPRSRPVFAFHRAETLADWLADSTASTSIANQTHSNVSAETSGVAEAAPECVTRGPTFLARYGNGQSCPVKLRRLAVDLIDKEQWLSMGADVKGDAYEGLLEKNAQDTKSGAGQYFTPRPLIQAIVDVMAPKPGETICDPACGTGGFLLAAHDYVVMHNAHLTKPQLKKLKEEAFKGWELAHATARLRAMNLLLHGIGSQDFEPIVVADSLAADPGERFDLALTNPPFGKKSSTTIVGEEGKVSKERDVVERGDFWTTTANKQLNFVQHVKTLLKRNGRAAVVVPDNVLFEGGAGETIRRKLLRRAHAAAPAHGPLLRPGREGQCALLRQEARVRNAMDEETLDLRSAHEQPLHAEYEPAEARGSRRLRGLLQSGKGRRSQGDVVRRESRGGAGASTITTSWPDGTRRASISSGTGTSRYRVRTICRSRGVIAAEIVADLEAALEQFRLIAEDLGPATPLADE